MLLLINIKLSLYKKIMKEIRFRLFKKIFYWYSDLSCLWLYFAGCFTPSHRFDNSNKTPKFDKSKQLFSLLFYCFLIYLYNIRGCNSKSMALLIHHHLKWHSQTLLALWSCVGSVYEYQKIVPTFNFLFYFIFVGLYSKPYSVWPQEHSQEMCELVLICVHQLGLIIDKDSHSVIFIQIHHHRLTGLPNPRTTCISWNSLALIIKCIWIHHF